MAGSIKKLSEYRLQKAREQLVAAETLHQHELFDVSLNRSYYAIFHAIRAVNALDEFDSSKHSGVIAHFNQFYIKTGKFDKKYSKYIRFASDLRSQADYEDFYICSEEESKEMMENAKEFIAEVEIFLKNIHCL